MKESKIGQDIIGVMHQEIVKNLVKEEAWSDVNLEKSLIYYVV